MKYIPTCLLILTSACTPIEKRAPSYEYSIVTMCRTGADALEVLTVRHTEKPLSPSQVATTREAATALADVCMQEDIPTEHEMWDIANDAVKNLLIIKGETE